MAARACSASLGRAKLLLRLARSGEIAAQACSVGLAGALDYAAQAYLDEETCEKAFRKRYARVATRSVRLCSVRLCSEHRYARVYSSIYIYTYEHGPVHIHAWNKDQQSQVCRASCDQSTAFSNSFFARLFVRVSLSSDVECLSEAERARAPNLSAPARPSRLEQN